MRTLLSLLVASAVCAGTVYAQPGSGKFGKGPKGDGFRAEVVEQLNLTEEQQTAMEKARYAMQEQMIELRATTQKAKLNTRKLMDADTIDREAVMAALEAESAAELALKKNRVEHMLNVRDILGPEKAAELRELMQERKGDQRGKGPRGGGWDDDSDDENFDRGQRRRR